MWVFTEDGSAAINLDHFMLIVLQKSDVGVGVMAYVNRGDMGTLLKVTDTVEEAQSFVNALMTSANGRRIENNQH